MLWRTHVVGGFLAGALVFPYCSSVDISLPMFVGCAGLSTLLPDIDSPESKLGRVFWPFSKILQLTAGHRGIFHSLLIPAALFGLLSFILPEYALPITIGYLSHILLDMLNPAGVPLFWPLPIHVSLPIIQTGGVIEKILFYPLVVWCGVLMLRIPGIF